MRRSLFWAFGLAIAFGALAATARAADSPDLTTIGLEAPGLVGQDQPSTMGDFTGKIGYAIFNRDNASGFHVFDADMRFQQGTALVGGVATRGLWGLT
jgi:hypothetical protein